MAYKKPKWKSVAFVWAVVLIRKYHQGLRFIIRTNHNVLWCWWIMRMTEGKRNLERWRLKLSEFDLKVVYQAGTEYQACTVQIRFLTTRWKNLRSRTMYQYWWQSRSNQKRKPRNGHKLWRSLPCSDGLDTVKQDLPEVLQVSDGTSN